MDELQVCRVTVMLQDSRKVVNFVLKVQKEVDHLARVLKHNGYPANFIRNSSAPPTQGTASDLH